MRNAYKILVGKPKRKKPRGEPAHRGVDWTEVSQNKVQWLAPVNAVMNCRAA